MPKQIDPLTMLYPSSKTALMQHLQTLVIRKNNYWIGGQISPEKFAGLVQKLAERYPITRDERGRIYDRSRGFATTHMVAYPSGGNVIWWILSSEGKGGLADPNSPDFKAARPVMGRESHIEFEDYTLVYAHKKDARTIQDMRTKSEITLFKDCSTWTWKLTSNAYSEALKALEYEIDRLNYGDDTYKAYGVRGVLHFQRQRPLFSGIRTQVLELHREALDRWARVRKQWQTAHPNLVQKYGQNAGQLRSLKEVSQKYLPKMSARVRVFSDEKRTFKSLADGVAV